MKDSTYEKPYSLEQMAFNDICFYMRPFPAINFKGHILDKINKTEQKENNKE